MGEVLERLIANHPDLEVKGKKTPYLAMNGNMFAFVDDTGAICLRLSEAGKAAYNQFNGTNDVLQYGAVMRGYVRVTDKILNDPETLAALFEECLTNAHGLRPKPTKKC